MAVSISLYPVRNRLPVKYSTEIGRIIQRWALIEWHLRSIVCGILDLKPEEGAIALREPRAVDTITMIVDLLSLKNIQSNYDWLRIKKEVEEIESLRNKLAHGTWIIHENTKIPVLQDRTGKHPHEKDPTLKKARIYSKSLEIPFEELKKYRIRLDQLNFEISHIRLDLGIVLEP